MARKTSSTPIAANVPDYRTEPITAVPFDSGKIMELFCSYDLKANPNLAEQASILYQVASDYEGDSRRLKLYADRLSAVATSLDQGQTPFYNLSSLAADIERVQVSIERGRETFKALCKVLGYKIEGGG